MAGRVVGTIGADPDGAGPRGYPATRTSYDSAGRAVLVETGELTAWQGEGVAPADWGSAFARVANVGTTYDQMGRKAVERMRQFGNTSHPATYQVTQYSYDALGRLECTAVRMNPDAFGNLPASACTLGVEGSFGPDRITKTVYDAAGQVLQVRKAVGTSLEQAEVTRSYTVSGKVEYTVDANGNRARFTYDGFDRLEKWCFPSKTRVANYDDATQAAALASAGAVNTLDCESYTYDANGNRLTLGKRDGSELSFEYDALNRMTRKTVPERAGLGIWHTRDVNYTYDLRGLETEARFDTSSQAIVTAYDGFGRVTSVTDSMDARNLVLRYEYDANGNRTALVHPDGVRVEYSYDGLNRAKTIGLPGAPYADGEYTYNNRGLVWVLKSYQNTTFTHDNIGRLSSLMIGLTGTAADVTQTFARNPAGQITNEAIDNNAYVWEGHANSTRAYTTNGLNQYTGAGAQAFTYDANGNLTSESGPGQDGVLRRVDYLYDVENRLVQIDHPAEGAVIDPETGETTTPARPATRTSMYYDPKGRLYTIIDTLTGTQKFLHDGDALTLEYSNNTAVTRRYVHGADVAADDPLVWYEGALANDTTRRRLKRDARGSIVAVADNLGNALAINSYDEYGIPGTAEDPNLGRFQYTGQVWLPEAGLYYYKARMYSPTLGRFMQTDPIGYDDQINLYAYVANDPVNAVDPDGKEAYCVSQPSACGTTKPVSAEEQAVRETAFEITSSVIPIGRGAQIVVTASRNPGFFTRVGRFFKRLFGGSDDAKKVTVSRSASPESARHLEESGATGRRLTVDRAGRDQRRRDNMSGTQTRSGTDRDESPPAVFKESENASVRNIPSSDNRSAGAQIGNQIRDLPDGACVKIEICP